MAARVEGIFDNETKKKITESELLLVGAGGIGCELLKTLVLIGFENIHVIDLDTIDLSNLNRQFLFHKQHIGKPKAVVAKESVLKYNPKANITSYHDSITNPKYNVEFYRQFTAVVNALDNVGARSHVNRMCMAADIPLIESGSAGYLGQTTVYKKNVTECFECLPKNRPKTYASCTIRNTPTEPVHCIVWAKHLFNQLFGESDADEDVSPDYASAEGDSSFGVYEYDGSDSETGNVERVPTREWAMSTNYDPHKIFKKLFEDDVLYLKTMRHLWKKRFPPKVVKYEELLDAVREGLLKRPQPKPLKFEELLDVVPGCSNDKGESEIQDQRNWSMKECGEIFVKCLTELRKRVEEGGPGTVLSWDKDDDVCLDFVAACSNLRSHCFSIPQKSRFDVKAIAGNIIPAIATTNAIVAGLVVLQLMKVLKGDLTKCKTSWINETYASSMKYISAGQLEKPNPLCIVCSSSAKEVKIQVNVKSITLRTVEDKILKEKLHMVQPDVFLNDGSGTIIISSDPDEMSEDQYEKPLSSFKVVNDSRLLCEDFLQNFKIHLIIVQENDLSSQDFKILSDVDNIKPEEEEEKEETNANDMVDVDDGKNDNEKRKHDELVMMDEPEFEILPVSDDENGVTEPPLKKAKT